MGGSLIDILIINKLNAGEDVPKHYSLVKTAFMLLSMILQ